MGKQLHIMKYIVIGLGNFGSSLAQQLTASGHEVIGIDVNMQKAEELKDTVTHTICLDITEQSAAATLPLKDSDAVIIAIGEDFGTSVKATALMKLMGAPRIIARAFTPLHETVLKAIGVALVINPEHEYAQQFAKRISAGG